MAPGWDPADIDGGDIAPMEAVMLDGGRTQPVSVESRRSTTPALDAGRALAVALKVDPARVTVLPTGSRGGQEIASVQSPPLIERLRQMMNESDNVMAESIGREVAAEQNRPQSFDGAVQAVLSQLDKAQDRHRRRAAARLQRAVRRRPADGRDPRRGGERRRRQRPAQPAAAAGSAADRGRQRHAVQPLPRHRRRPRRRGIPAGQDRIVDRNQLVGRDRHRREWTGADVRVHLQQRRADRPHGDRRAVPPSCGRAGAAHEPVDQVHGSPSAAPSTGSSRPPSAPNSSGPAPRPPTTPAARSSIS